ncbi:MAG: hypothetical protein ORN85_07665 [Sediminibacterium sp.]|nr:hypothetical protein [Sediminibacterium sp.]
METSKTLTTKHWVLFVIWLVILVFMFINFRQFAWMALPGFCTSFVKGMKLI